jgi:hypothetical protein
VKASEDTRTTKPIKLLLLKGADPDIRVIINDK